MHLGLAQYEFSGCLNAACRAAAAKVQKALGRLPRGQRADACIVCVKPKVRALGGCNARLTTGVAWGPCRPPLIRLWKQNVPPGPMQRRAASHAHRQVSEATPAQKGRVCKPSRQYPSSVVCLSLLCTYAQNNSCVHPGGSVRRLPDWDPARSQLDATLRALAALWACGWCKCVLLLLVRAVTGRGKPSSCCRGCCCCCCCWTA